MPDDLMKRYLGWAWWFMPAIPAIQEAEMGRGS
jgi:hypothetical protein